MKDLLKLFKYQHPVDDFDAIRIGLASPDRFSGRSRTTSASAASTSASSIVESSVKSAVSR
jgi:hypothetical protein